MKKRLCQDFKIATGVRVLLEASLRIDQTYLKFFFIVAVIFLREEMCVSRCSGVC